MAKQILLLIMQLLSGYCACCSSVCMHVWSLRIGHNVNFYAKDMKSLFFKYCTGGRQQKQPYHSPHIFPFASGISLAEAAAVIIFVMTKLLSRQAYFCHEKRCVLSRQTRVCCDKTFVTTKMIFVAAPASDAAQHHCRPAWQLRTTAGE